MVQILKTPNPIDVEVGRRLKMQRLACGMTQTELGNKIQVTFQQVQKYERGTNRLGASRLQAAAHVLAVPISFFFEHSPGEPGPAFKSTAVGTDVMAFISSSEGLALNAAFGRVKKTEVRRRIVSLVEAISFLSDVGGRD
ncbi:helix-turn-helix domain-containing protein [Rhizobium sp. 18055]|uniref:helix-turn-helix domain-containing protein n=1 Tax=Rhizobium sp. 18055 TaxID=2681403 RepID=UPI00135C8260|nr:helix-turn-helix transcriptional regulator [Rhizobium sp. 18055]